MSWAWFVVGLFLWVACWPYLSPISRRSPPTHMQLLFYYYILKAAGKKSGANAPGTQFVGKITRDQVKEIAEAKMQDLNAVDIEGAMAIIEGSARSMGVQVEG